MRVLVHNTRPDFIALSERAAQFRLGFAYKFLRRIYPRFCLVLGIGYSAFLFFYWRSMTPIMLVQAVYTNVFLLGASWMWPLSYLLNFSSAKRKQQFGVPFSLELAGDGVQIAHEGGDHFISWAEFHHVSRDEQSLFLIRNGRNSQNLVVPDRSFSSADEANSFSSVALDFWLHVYSARAPIAAP